MADVKYADVVDVATGKINNENFIKFALHLFIGTVDNIKYTTDRGAVKSPLQVHPFRLRYWKLMSQATRRSCENIETDLVKEPKIPNYTSVLGGLANTLNFNNEGNGTNNTAIGNTLLGAGGAAAAPASVGGRSIKTAIKAVIECFVPSSTRTDYSYDKFLTWLALPDANREGVSSVNGVIENAGEWIKKWSAYLIKEHKTGQTTLEGAINPLMSSLGLITIGGAPPFNLAGVGAPAIQDAEQALQTFQNDIKSLNPESLKHYKNVHSKEGNSLYNKLLMDNDAMKFTIKALRYQEEVQPNNDITQIAIDSQYHRALLFKEIKARIGNVNDSGGDNNFNAAFDVVLNMSQYAMSSIGAGGAVANNGQASRALRVAISNGANQLNGGHINGNGAVPGGGGANFVGAQIAGIIAAFGGANAAPIIALPGGGQNGLPGGALPNVANVNAVLAFYNKYKTGAEAKAGGGGGAGGDEAEKYWNGINHILQGASWNQLPGPAAAIPNPNHAYFVKFSSVGSNDQLPYDDQMINRLKNGIDARKRPNGVLNPALLPLEQKSTLTPLEHIQIIADCAVAQIADKIMKADVQYNNSANVIGAGDLDTGWNNADEARQMILDIDGLNLFTNLAPANDNIDGMIAVHYGVFLAAAKAAAGAGGGIQAIPRTTGFANFTPDDIAPNGQAPNANGVQAPAGPVRAAVPDPVWTSAIRAAMDIADRYVTLFVPQ